MCGLFGYSGSTNADPLKLMILADKSRDRGTHSLGVFGNGILHKTVKSYSEAVLSLDWKKMCGHEVLGHNRYATIGKHTVDNAHPFLIKHETKGNMVGTHNGFALNDKALREKYGYNHDVDSFNILSIINEHGIDELKNIEGPLALAYYKDGKLHLISRSKWLHIGVIGKNKMYYSSEPEPLKWIGIKEENIQKLDLNTLYVFKDGKMVEEPRHIEEPILKFDVDSVEPKLYTWRHCLSEGCASKVTEATGGEHKTYIPQQYTPRNQNYSTYSGTEDDTVHGFQHHKRYNEMMRSTRQASSDSGARAIGESVLFDHTGDYNFFNNLADIKCLPERHIKNVNERSVDAKVDGCSLTLKIMKEGQDGETDNAENMIVKVAGIDDLYMTNEMGLCVIPIRSPHVDTERRVYVWDEYAADDKPFYTKRIKMIKGTVLEVAVILPFRIEAEEEEDGYEYSSGVHDYATSEQEDYPTEGGYYDEWEDYRRWDYDDVREAGEQLPIAFVPDQTKSGMDSKGISDGGGDERPSADVAPKSWEWLERRLAEIQIESDDDLTTVSKEALMYEDLDLVISDIEAMLDDEEVSEMLTHDYRDSLNRALDVLYERMATACRAVDIYKERTGQ